MYKPLKHKPQNIFERIFGAGSSSVGSAPAPAPVAAATPAASPAPAAAPATQGQETEQDPLAKFKDLWNVDPNKVDPARTPIFGEIDPKKLQEAASQLDFSKVLDNETLSKMKAGGDEGLAASVAAMNRMIQQSYAQSAMATTKIVEQALAKQQEKFQQMIPDLVKRSTVSQTLQGDNPIFSRPEVAPIIGALQFQLTAQYPNASPSEISEMAKEYLGGLAKVLGPKSQSSATDTKSGPDNFDWDAFANS